MPLILSLLLLCFPILIEVKYLLEFCLQRSIFCKLKRIAEFDIILLDMYLIAETKDISQADPVNNLRRRAAIYLFREDMIQPLGVIWKECFHALALIKARDNFCYVHTGLHIEVSECSIRIIKAAGILFLQPIHHILHDTLRCKDLVGSLRRNVVKNILSGRFIEIICKLFLFA